MSKSQDTRSFVLRVDAAAMEALEAWADDEFRSINGQLQWILADALRRSGRLPGRRRARSGRGVAPEEVAPVEAAPEGAAPEGGRFGRVGVGPCRSGRSRSKQCRAGGDCVG